jgi:membrane associated rhomboid family serine protease
MLTRSCGGRDAVITRWQMGIADRDYHREDRREGGGFFAQLTPVVKWLLILNLGLYFLDLALENKPLRHFGAFAMQSAVFEGRIWEFITFQFLHGSVGHVLFNCMAIFFFGPFIERWWGSRKFLTFYLLCGIGGGAFFALLTVLHLLPETWVPLSMIHPSETAGLIVRDGMALIPQSLVGASAGIYGILIGVAVVAPDLRVALLFPPIELSMRQLAMALLAIAVGIIIFRFGNEGGEAGHLGGAIVGFLLMRYPQLLGRGPRIEIVKPKVFSPHPAPKMRPRTTLEKNEASAVDAILDKISRDGFQSLTQEERDFLQKVSNSKHSS